MCGKGSRANSARLPFSCYQKPLLSSFLSPLESYLYIFSSRHVGWAFYSENTTGEERVKVFLFLYPASLDKASLLAKFAKGKNDV